MDACRIGVVSDLCELDNEPLATIKEEKFHNSLNYYQLPRRTLLHGFGYSAIRYGCLIDTSFRL
jgi:hypothetical protein